MGQIKKPICYIVGIGPGGSPKWLTHAAEDALKLSDIILAWEWSLEPVKTLVAGKKLFFQGTKDYLAKEIEAAGDAMKSGETVAVLRVGDPCVSSSLAQLLEVFKGFDIRIVPSAGAAQFAAAKAQICLDESVLVSFHDGHEEVKKKKLEFLVDCWNNGRHLVIFTNETQMPHETARFLIDRDINAESEVLVCEHMTMADEHIYEGFLRDIPGTLFRSTSVMVVKNGTTGCSK